jgi:predicted nucleic acid-binding protein
MVLVLDACALIAYIRDEQGAERVESLLVDQQNQCYVHAINMCEVYYLLFRAFGEARAKQAVDDIRGAGVQVYEHVSEALWMDAGHLKAVLGIPIADSYVAALSRALGGEVVTTDHTDFDEIARGGFCTVQFIR